MPARVGRGCTTCTRSIRLSNRSIGARVVQSHGMASIIVHHRPPRSVCPLVHHGRINPVSYSSGSLRSPRSGLSQSATSDQCGYKWCSVRWVVLNTSFTCLIARSETYRLICACSFRRCMWTLKMSCTSDNGREN